VAPYLLYNVINGKFYLWSYEEEMSVLSQNDNCIFCGQQVKVTEEKALVSKTVNCPNCGKYEITWEANEDLPYEFERRLKGKKHLVSGFIREMNELGLKLDLITTGNIEQFYNNSFIPNNPIGKADKVIRYLYRRTSYFGEENELDINNCAISYAVKPEEFYSIIRLLEQRDYIDIETLDAGYYLKANGYERVQELESKNEYSKQAFVAMWFNPELDIVFSDFISKAIEETGFKPLRIDGKEHVNKICDEIIAEIKKSRFIIADFTGQRGGVYYEAGFAHGLGIPVIWTCRKDAASDLHFDIRQYNCIIWETGEELYQRLKSRIEAVIV